MKKIISILICIQITLFPAFAFASNVGGWTLGGGVAQGASTVYEGTKKVIIDGKDYIKKGTAIVTPTATGVAKVLAKGVAGVALSVAVEQLLGAVDWVLDPANNQIVYSVEKKPEELCNQTNKCETKPTLFKCSYTNYTSCKNTYSSPKAAVSAFLSEVSSKASVTSCDLTKRYCTLSQSTPYGSSIPFSAFANPNYDPAAEEEKPESKTLPLEVVAQKVISNAAGGDAAAQVATTAAAADIVAEAEKDNVKARPIAQQLEASSSTKPADEAAAAQANTATGTQTQNPTKPDATDLKLEFPAFCGWAPIVCEAAQVVISFPNTLTGWWDTTNQKADSWASSIAEAWASVKEWATGEPDLQEDQTDLPIEEQTLDRDPSSFDTDYIVLGSQCPTFEPYTVEVGPVSKTLSMDLSPLCDFAAKVRPAILGMSYLTAAGIVVAAIRET